jgi:hypothetical protein
VQWLQYAQEDAGINVSTIPGAHSGGDVGRGRWWNITASDGEDVDRDRYGKNDVAFRMEN